MANIPLVYNVSLVDVQKFRDFGTFANNFDDFGNLRQVYSVTQSVSGSLNYVSCVKSKLSSTIKLTPLMLDS